MLLGVKFPITAFFLRLVKLHLYFKLVGQIWFGRVFLARGVFGTIGRATPTLFSVFMTVRASLVQTADT